ncbi:MAG: nucleotide sugar dehydrogenase [Clostridiales Family XIII bacterium]|jgi:UDP-N-acetyl-D-galactosamine dehydrogenase|nr:nucleotide sugar dehydrogenase [Clostridiales Family XIII bacterium]
MNQKNASRAGGESPSPVTINDLTEGRDKLSLIGLGYVGLPIAVAFSKHCGVVGYDASPDKISRLNAGVDPTAEVGAAALAASLASAARAVVFTDDPAALAEARFHIVAVPTPVKSDHTPDLGPLESASAALGARLRPGSIVVYESTVYPGVTENVCVPLLEKASGLKCGRDFKVGYSPERINPGDREHRLESIVKVVSGMDGESLDTIAAVYSLVAKAGVYRAPSIKVAEAAKVIENSQRDINIAFMNELAIIFEKMGIPTGEVLEAAGTKWNFLKFTPGLVGGHCIGVDPYYLTYAAEQLGYHSRIILQGRFINDGMGQYVAQRAAKLLSRAGRPLNEAKVAILGITFKEDCPDTRNTRVVDIIDELREYGIEPLVWDPVADPAEVEAAYGIPMVDGHGITGMDAVIVAVKHRAFAGLDIESMLAGGGIIFDLKGAVDGKAVKDHEYFSL